MIKLKKNMKEKFKNKCNYNILKERLSLSGYESSKLLGLHKKPRYTGLEQPTCQDLIIINFFKGQPPLNDLKINLAYFRPRKTLLKPYFHLKKNHKTL
jgi:hypothetical protein